MFKVVGGNLKFFGRCEFPEMSPNRPMEEVKRMLDAMAHYCKAIEENQPW